MKGECQSCGYETELMKFRSPRIGEEDYEFCALCGATPASDAVMYKRQDQSIYATIAYIGNVIVDMLEQASP